MNWFNTMGNSNRQENLQSYIHLNHYSFQKPSIDFLEKNLPEKLFSFLTETLSTEIIQKPWETNSPCVCPRHWWQSRCLHPFCVELSLGHALWFTPQTIARSLVDLCPLPGQLSVDDNQDTVPRGTLKEAVQSGILRWL